MIYIEALLLTAMMFFGCYCARTDIQSGIVLNRILLIGCCIGGVLHIALLIAEGGVYYPYWLLNMLIADIISFAMFLVKIWAAGDAKLFMLLYLFTPPRLFDYGILSGSITPFICIFVPALLFLAVDSIARLIRKEKHKSFRKVTIKGFLWSFLFVTVETTAFYSILSMVFRGIGFEHGLFVAGLMLMYAYLCKSVPVMQKWYVFALHAVILLITFAINGWRFALPSGMQFLLVPGAFMLQRICSLYNYQLISIEKVSKGMILSAETVALFQMSRIHSLPRDPSEELTAKITEEEAEAVRRWGHSSNGLPEIWIVRKIPLALMIWIGFVIWMMIRVWRR